TLQSAARLVAQTLIRFLSSTGSDEEIGAFVEELGWTLPVIPSSIGALGTAGGEMLDALTDVEVAADAVENDGGDEQVLRDALQVLVLRVADFASQVNAMKASLTAELPANFVAATGMPDAFATRLFESLAVRELSDRAGLATAIAA